MSLSLSQISLFHVIDQCAEKIRSFSRSDVSPLTRVVAGDLLEEIAHAELQRMTSDDKYNERWMTSYPQSDDSEPLDRHFHWQDLAMVLVEGELGVATEDLHSATEGTV